MERLTDRFDKTALARLFLIIVLFIGMATPTSACTIFVLTDGRRVFFCNNEDWTNPATRIWFVPGGTGYYGCVYIGYDDGWARGGMNTEGLACDWVGGFNEDWRSNGATCVRGNPTERLLESCTTVDEAIAFLQRHKEPDFTRAKIFVADKTGSSAVVGVVKGNLQIDQVQQSRCFGYAFRTYQACFTEDSAVTVANGASILHACLQEGRYATKYSNIFDLKSGDIYLYQFHQGVDSIRMNLGLELAKGGHYFDMVQIHPQFSMPVMPLPLSMRRFVLDEFPPIPDPRPNTTKHIRTILEDAISGTMRTQDYQSAFWSFLSPLRKEIQRDLRRLGKLQAITLVESKTAENKRINRYRVDFQNLCSLMRFELDDDEKVLSFRSEATERKPGADLGE
jgi:hypothetical protein